MEEDEQQLQAVGTFEGFILSQWAELFELSERFRINYIQNHKEFEVNTQYFSKLTRIWGALKPKVKGRTDMKELEDKFMLYEKYYYDPNGLNDEDNSEDIFKMEAIMEEVLDKLCVTTFSNKKQ